MNTVGNITCRMRPKLLGVILLTTMGMTSCFTGVESTPRITYKGSKEHQHTASPESAYIAGVCDQPVMQWVAGKEFIVTPGKITYALAPWDKASRLEPGDTLRYVSLHGTTSPTGALNSDIVLAHRTDTLYYRLEDTPDTVLTRRRLEIPFTIEVSTVDKARKLLQGNTYWIMTNLWYRDDTTTYKGRKMIPVHIDSVTAGNSLLPIKIMFTDDDNRQASVFMTPSTTARLTRSFESQFSLSDPRLRYRDITDQAWDCITRSTVKEGMTRPECKLALGMPREVIQAHYIERWNYDNGRYLIFDDNQLVQYKL